MPTEFAAASSPWKTAVVKRGRNCSVLYSAHLREKNHKQMNLAVFELSHPALSIWLTAIQLQGALLAAQKG